MPHRSVLAGSESLLALGRALREQRKERALTLEMLAVDAEVERSYLGAIERGEVNVTVHVLCRICQAMALKPSELFAHGGMQKAVQRLRVTGRHGALRPCMLSDSRHWLYIRHAYNLDMPAPHFEWDPKKAAANLRKHKVSFEDAQ